MRIQQNRILKLLPSFLINFPKVRKLFSAISKACPYNFWKVLDTTAGDDLRL
jgi:hypothetical protein